MLTTQHPQGRLPARPIETGLPRERQHEPRRPAEPTAEDASEPLALFGVVKLVVDRVDVDRQEPLTVNVGERILVGRDHVLAADLEPVRQSVREALGVGFTGTSGPARITEQRSVGPQRRTIGSPVAGEGPPRERLAGIPLALAEVQQSAGCVAVTQPANQRGGQPLLRLAERGSVPLVPVHVVDGNERGLTTDGQPHVVRSQFRVDGVAEREDTVPLAVGVWASRAGPRAPA